MTNEIMLNPDLDVPALSRKFARDRRVLCTNVFKPSVARRLLTGLQHEIKWGIAFIENGQLMEFPADERVLSNLETEVGFLERAYEACRSGFSFFYETNPRMASDRNGKRFVNPQEADVLRLFLSFLNSDSCLSFFREVAGMPSLQRADAQASRYNSGCFLRRHNDELKADRTAAYVFNLSQQWDTDWGGLLQFLSTDGNVIETYTPQFNSMAVFAIPQYHAVSMITPFAKYSRYAISGWLYTGES